MSSCLTDKAGVYSLHGFACVHSLRMKLQGRIWRGGPLTERDSDVCIQILNGMVWGKRGLFPYSILFYSILLPLLVLFYLPISRT